MHFIDNFIDNQLSHMYFNLRQLFNTISIEYLDIYIPIKYSSLAGHSNQILTSLLKRLIPHRCTLLALFETISFSQTIRLKQISQH